MTETTTEGILTAAEWAALPANLLRNYECGILTEEDLVGLVRWASRPTTGANWCE